MAEDVPDFDVPIYKRLARNDTGEGSGHQAGIVIPADLISYFPTLADPGSWPTSDHTVRAILVDPHGAQTLVETRYQYQTWGGTRSPEYRLTANLGFVRDKAKAGDFIQIERGVEDRDLYRLTLIKAGTTEHARVQKGLAPRHWGVLTGAEAPVKDSEIEKAETEQKTHEQSALDLFDNAAALVETRVQRISRSKAFQKRVLEIYDNKCTLCNAGLVHPTKGREVEAAHIVPRSQKGADDARNGLALCRAHHWAFDRGLFGISSAGTVEIPPELEKIPENAALLPYKGKALRAPNKPSLAPAPGALEWHLTNIVRMQG